LLYLGDKSTSSNVNAFDFTLSMSDYSKTWKKKKSRVFLGNNVLKN
jgi:hypothetical protein